MGISEANQTEFSGDCFPLVSSAKDSLCDPLLNAVTDICSSTRNLIRVQNILICINILSNGKQVIHYNYFVHCLKYTSCSNLFHKTPYELGVQEMQRNHMALLLQWAISAISFRLRPSHISINLKFQTSQSSWFCFGEL